MMQSSDLPLEVIEYSAGIWKENFETAGTWTQAFCFTRNCADHYTTEALPSLFQSYELHQVFLI